MFWKCFYLGFVFYSLTTSGCETLADANNESRSSATPIYTKQSAEVSPTPVPPETQECGERRASVLLISAAEGDGRAAEEYAKLIDDGCDSAYTRYLLGQALEGDRQFAKAAAQFRTSVRMNPEEWAPQIALARVLILKLGKFDEGLIELEAARKIDDLDDLSYTYDYYLGRALEGKGQLKDALIHYRRFEKGQASVNKVNEQYRDVLERIERIQREKISK